MRKPLAVNSRDVARLAGVAQSTVSKVANNSANLSDETRRRVIQAARELGYSLNQHKKNYCIAVIVPESRYIGYIAAMLWSLSQELINKGMRMEILQENNLELLNDRCIDGAISINWKKELTSQWGEMSSLPLVRINAPSNHQNNCYSVCPNGIGSLQKTIDLLWKMGHRKIGFFFFNSLHHEHNNYARRLDGFIQAMEKHGVNAPERYCLFDCLRKESCELISQLQHWYQEGVSAIIFSNALGTGKMMQAIQLAGLRIPEDISVIGWEQPLFSDFTIPPLSTLSPDYENLSKSAVDLLLKLISKRSDVQDILMPYCWIKRESIAPNHNFAGENLQNTN